MDLDVQQTVETRYGMQLTNNVQNHGVWVSHFKHLGMNELNEILLHQAFNLTSQTSGSSAGYNTQKNYMYDCDRHHTWRNNCAFADVHVEFWALHARDNIPVSATVGTMAPPETNDYKTGGGLVAPTAMSTLEQETPAFTGGVDIVRSSLSTTPFSFPNYASLFKIRRLKVAGPGGKKSKHLLLPGQECRFTGRFRGPMMVNYNKFGLTANDAETIGDLYEVLKKTPLIYVFIRGTVSHSDATLANVGLGVFALDYFQAVKWKFLQAGGPVIKQSVDTTASEVTLVAPVQANLVTGTTQAEAIG